MLSKTRVKEIINYKLGGTEMSALIQMVKDRGELLRECRPFLEREGDHCECGDVGYFVETDSNGDPEQAQCEFCYCYPTSEFNRQSLLKHLEEI